MITSKVLSRGLPGSGAMVPPIPERGAGRRPAERYVPRDRKLGFFLVAALTAVLLCVFIGIAIDAGLWYRTARSMRSAADAAARAAARDGGSDYRQTGKSAAAQLGFVDGHGGITVRVLSDQECADGRSACYKATIDETVVPGYLSRMMGIPMPPLSISATAQMTRPAVQRRAAR